MLTVLKSGSLNLLDLPGPVQACNEIALPLLYSVQNLLSDRSGPVLNDLYHRVSTYWSRPTSKGKVKGEFRPQAMEVQRKSRGIVLLCINLSDRWGWVMNATPRLLHPHETDPVPTLQKAGWAPGQFWTGVENLAPTRIRSPNHAASSKSL